MARMDTVDLSSGDEVYTPDVEEVEDDLFSLFSNHVICEGEQSEEEITTSPSPQMELCSMGGGRRR